MPDSPATRPAGPAAGPTAVSWNRSARSPGVTVGRAGYEPPRGAEGNRGRKRVTAHTLRHTAATWLRQELGDARLVAEYLGHADLSTVARYAHVERDELFAAAKRLSPETP